jgi:hypothetical protein
VMQNTRKPKAKLIYDMSKTMNWRDEDVVKKQWQRFRRTPRLSLLR